jgi:hypothetical protein
MVSNDDFKTIAELDLDPIKVKLMHKESGEGWSLEKANAMEAEYRRFLYLMKKFPTEQVAPLFDVDIFWHYHILDTMKYAVDCQAVFGYFLHHFPYVGLRGEEDEIAHQRVGARMKELYEETFHEPFVRVQDVEQTALPGAAVEASAPSAAQTAWSMVATPLTAQGAQTAWSMVATPLTARATQTAWSMVATPLTAQAAQTAWSMVATPLTAQAAEMSRFFSERPTLTAAA